MPVDEIKKALPYLQDLYGQTKAREITEELEKYGKDISRIERSEYDFQWYKYLNLYIIYPDGLNFRKNSAFERLTDHLEHVQKMGFNAVHILPFLVTNGVDRGFDIKDYFTIDSKFGNKEELIKLKNEAERLGLRLFMDLVFNHVSDAHPWFKKAQKGDERYREYFIYKKDKPKFIKKFHKDAAVWAKYEVEGEEINNTIAFPEAAGEIPHWREGKDGYWYYHTYYPQ